MRVHRPTALAGAVVGGAALLAGGLGGARVAAAAPVVPAAVPHYGVAFGDVTGDGRRDRISIESGTTATGIVTCTALVKPGLPGGGVGYPVRVRLPVQGLQVPNSLPSCPDLLVVLPGPTPTQNRLATNWHTFAPAGGTSVQVFDLTGGSSIARYDSGFSGQSNPSGGISTADFDGDGWGDIYQEGTDQGEGVDLFVRRGDAWARFYGSGYTPRGSATVVNLDHGPGTDVIVSTLSDGINTPIVTVVDGRTARTQNLVTGDYYGDPGVFGYQVAVVDIDGDAFSDLAVTPVTDGGTPVTRYFVNRSQDGKWKFVETRQRPAAT